jgi:hypothetical protein
LGAVRCCGGLYGARCGAGDPGVPNEFQLPLRWADGGRSLVRGAVGLPAGSPKRRAPLLLVVGAWFPLFVLPPVPPGSPKRWKPDCVCVGAPGRMLPWAPVPCPIDRPDCTVAPPWREKNCVFSLLCGMLATVRLENCRDPFPGAGISRCTRLAWPIWLPEKR